jgi:hypothetical protein
MALNYKPEIKPKIAFQKFRLQPVQTDLAVVKTFSVAAVSAINKVD